MSQARSPQVLAGVMVTGVRVRGRATMVRGALIGGWVAQATDVRIAYWS